MCLKEKPFRLLCYRNSSVFFNRFLLRKKALYLWRWSISLLAGGHTAGYARWLSFGANNHLSSFRLSGNYLALTGLAKP